MSSAIELPSGERLGFTLFVALLVHALILFGVSFKLTINKQTSPTLEITLATHKSSEAPDEADFLAQFDQQGSGTADEAKQITTEQVAEFADTEIQEVREAQLARTQQERPEDKVVTTVSKSRSLTSTDPSQERQEEVAIAGDGDNTVPVSEQIASLKARLDEQREAYAKKPRVRRLTSVAAKASVEASYLYQWSQKVEFVGNRNFPQEALAEGIRGNLRLLAVVDRDGTLLSAEILQSSGYRVLDDAAIQIVHLSSPFPPFPKEIRETADRLEIIRTWSFEITGLSTGS
ncbi:energy transducer TonB [Halioxenophilus sp. WMMB6]|uniref:energy transducer TonB n=1 Tax=Halioxenophilus sp. WMMB6 TaxID=3073815 RepID=UPI00295EF376|nr:energy transducer TonB [Halioxenophilus sp. WMMB6]